MLFPTDHKINVMQYYFVREIFCRADKISHIIAINDVSNFW